MERETALATATPMIYYPDVSKYNAGLRIQPNTVAVGARATLSDSYVDPAYQDFMAQTKNVGGIGFAYHWLNHGNLAAQAAHCYSVVGYGVPVMIDAEDVAGNTGYNGTLTVDDLLGFAAEYRKWPGAICSLAYLPHWYWENRMGSPDLTPLVAAGLALVSSNYSAPISDTWPGWQSYGGVSPSVGQYTDALPYGGFKIDFNAYRGTVDQFRDLLHAAPPVVPTPAPPPPPPAPQQLLVDGVWGALTTRRLQQFAGTTADGVISMPPAKSSIVGWLQNQLNNHGFRDEHGARLIVDYDGRSFMPQDGHHTHSIAALERAMLGVASPDCYLSTPSGTVREMQRRLNAGRLF